MEGFFELFIVVVFIGVTYVIGKIIEMNHYEKIEAREKEHRGLPCVTARRIFEEGDIEDCRLVTGSVVISGDYFKLILSGLMNFFGGRIIGYESLIDRARREALLRLKDDARKFQADAVINTRFSTSKLDGNVQSKSTGMFELLAYGTAVRLKK
jgi:uncharacterized protein YbjQ (UPF0145 family)